tara:strand:- start:14029 stop:14931 length:903 start_codon:yes stop_codon:yes gene_type:complete
MRICFNNVDFYSNSGPNQFAGKLAHGFHDMGHAITTRGGDVQLSFISTTRKYAPVALRLDGIYFNSAQEWERMNEPIKASYDDAAAIIIQSEFDLGLVKKYFGNRDNLHVIHNGTYTKNIDNINPINDHKLDNRSEVWLCASHWRPHKRLDENIRYFHECAPSDACMIVAGTVDDATMKKLGDDRIFFVGDVVWTQLIGLCKRADKFVHMSWLDHCPNVVVDARASGCQIICSSTGGTKEIAGKNAIIIQEDEWDLNPTKLYEPPKMDFSKIVHTGNDSSLDILSCAKKYLTVLETIAAG